MPARAKWWDDVVKTDIAPYYAKADKAKNDKGELNSKGEPKASPGGSRGSFIWGDRVRVLERSGDAVKVSGRGTHSWVHKRHLGGEALLEIYVIDVGQGDGLLVVTPEGHNIMVDGGNIRRNQNGGKNAADFVDWKFYKDYLSWGERDDPAKTKIELDAMVASHNDLDHFGGLWDLIDQDEKNRAELDCSDVTVETLFHAGLSWWFNGRDSRGNPKRSLGDIDDGHYTKLLGNRSSARAATRNRDNPDFDTLHGSWGSFVRAATLIKRKSGAPTSFDRVSTQTDEFLPGFGPGGASACTFRILGPVETEIGTSPGLKKFPDGDSKNTNGHSVVLRLDYGDRRILLTGDLNTHSQHHIMDHFGDDFVSEYMCDVAKGCHHGSHDVSLAFLEGVRPLTTVISSGDAETHDHPRPNIVAASAITGRRLIDRENDTLLAPLVYMTEVARSVKITDIHDMREFSAVRPAFEAKRPTGAKQIHDTAEEMGKYRLFLSSSPTSPFQWPRLDHAKVVRGLRYGLVNVRTDGSRLFFAQMEESGSQWAVTSFNADQISEAR